MGIKGLLPFLKANNCTKPITHPLWPADSVIAVDVPIFAHKFVYTERSISGLMRRMVDFGHELKALGSRPIFVFDGEKLALKDAERRHRAAVRDRELDKAKIRQSALMETLAAGCSGPTDDIVIVAPPAFFKASSDAISGPLKEPENSFKGLLWPTAKDYRDLSDLLVANGFDVARARYEAEALCAHMTATGRAYAVLTEDSDVLAFGATRAIFKYTSTEPIQVEIATILSNLGLTLSQFIDLCCMFGCDFCDNVYMMGPNTAFKALKTHGTWAAIKAAYEQTPHEWPHAMQCQKTAEAIQTFDNLYPEVHECFATRAFETTS